MQFQHSINSEAIAPAVLYRISGIKLETTKYAKSKTQHAFLVILSEVSIINCLLDFCYSNSY